FRSAPRACAWRANAQTDAVKTKKRSYYRWYPLVLWQKTCQIQRLASGYSYKKKRQPLAGCLCKQCKQNAVSAGLLFHEGAFDHEVARGGGVAFLEVAGLEHVLEGVQHLGAAAQHDAVHSRIQRGQADVLREDAVFDLVGDA